MPYTIGDGAILSVTFESLVKSQQNLTVLHYQYVGVDTLPDGRQALDDLLEKITDAGELYENYQNCLSNDATAMRVVGQWITPLRYARITKIGAETTGQVLSAIFAPNMAFAITKQGDRANRHNIGTVHMPAVPNSFIGGAEMNGAGFIAYGNFAAEMKNPIEVGVGGPIYSPVIFNRANPNASATFDNYTINSQTRTMRRRTVGVGS